MSLCANSAQQASLDGVQEDGQAGLQEMGGNATLLFYQTPEGNEGRQAYLEKRRPDFLKVYQISMTSSLSSLLCKLVYHMQTPTFKCAKQHCKH